MRSVFSLVTRSGHSAVAGLGTVPWQRRSRTRDDLPKIAVKVDTSWRSRGTCKDYPLPEFEHYWYPEGADVEPEAKAICAGCPVRERCEEYGRQHEAYGVWGGTSKAEQQALARRARREAIRNGHEAVIQKCASPTCEVVFDTMRTLDGKPASRQRIFCSKECKLANRRRKERDDAVCKCGCGEVFKPFFTYDGRKRREPRQFYSPECFSRYKSAIQTRDRSDGS